MTYPLPPNAVDLTFVVPSSPPAPTAVDLTFGASSGPPPGTVYPASLSGRFTLRGSATVNTSIGVWRGLSAATVVQSQQGAPLGATRRADWDAGAELRHRVEQPFDAAAEVEALTAAAWQPPVEVGRHTTAAWDDPARGVERVVRAAWLLATHRPISVREQWQRTALAEDVRGLRFGLARATPKAARVPWQQATAQGRVVDAPAGRAAKVSNTFRLAPWQRALVLASTGGPSYLPPPPTAPPPTPETLQDLRFCALYPEGGHPSSGLVLVLGLNPCGSVTPDSPVYILPARFYMAVHSLQAHVLPSLEAVPIFGVSLAADVGSFAWTFSATGPASLFDALAPDGAGPKHLRITLDGEPWVFVVDGVSQTQAFGQRGARVTGRSATAAIGAPYARETSRLNSTAQNAQQLALLALTNSGVGLDWGLTDWLVPAGAWSHSGTPLAAVQAIAEAAGGHVNSHRSSPTLLVRHPYPTLPGGIPGGPWNWEGAAGAFAADVELAPDAIITRSVERQDGPDVDGIYVSGTAQGVLAHVRRTGTLGAKLAPMVTDALITANAAAQQRGLSVLGQAGAKHQVQITLPILVGGANPGVLDVGQLVQVNDPQPWRGRVRSVSVQASLPTVQQTVSLERHLA